MTLEASFIIPWIFMTFILSIYFCFHLYNHCVVYQDCYIAALRGSEIRNADTGFVKEYVENQIIQLLDNQLYEYTKEAEVNVTLTKVEVSSNSAIKLPWGDLMLYRNKLLDIEKSAIANRLNPVYLIRISGR